MLQVLPATREHAARLAPALRDADRREIIALTSYPPEQTLAFMVTRSIEVYAAVHGADVLALAGLSTLGVKPTADGAEVWSFSAAELDRYPRLFLRVSRDLLRRWLRMHWRLTTCIDLRNTAAVHLAERFGFLPGEMHGEGANGAVYRKFQITRKH